MKNVDQNIFTNEVRRAAISTPYVIIKPGWVSDEEGIYTEPEILDWLMQALPEQKKIVVESYTPWRSPVKIRPPGFRDDLEGGKEFWDFYKKQDKNFFDKTGLSDVLEKNQADYINITNEYWAGRCVAEGRVKSELGGGADKIKHQEFLQYIPQKIFDLREQSTLISLAKIKTEKANPSIVASMSVKNIFGLVPHPSRFSLHGHNDQGVAPAVIDINRIYTKLFNNTVWIAEGVNTWIDDYMSESPKINREQGLLFVGRDGCQVDAEACRAVGVDPQQVPYLNKL